MSKDPAFLFYSSDFLTGVLDLTMAERGQYITLLCLQHQKGRLSEKTIGLNLGDVSKDVLAKFEVDEEGLYYNERLEAEIEKRSQHKEKQRENGKLGGRPKKPELDNLGEINGKHYLYLIYDNINNQYKIGETKNLKQRRYDIKRPTNNLEIVNYCLSTALECQEHEREILNDFSEFSVGGDWFEFTKKEVDEIVKKYFSKIPKKYPNDSQKKARKKPLENENDNVNDNVNKKENKYTQSFEEFWHAYPRKVDKGNALEKYTARLKDGRTEAELLEAAKNYAKTCKAEKTEVKFIKHAATFLSSKEPFEDYLDCNYVPPVKVKEATKNFNNFDARPYEWDTLEQQLLNSN